MSTNAASGNPAAGIILLVGVALAATLILWGKSPFFLIGRVVAGLFRPLVKALRFLRIIPRAGRVAKPEPGVRAYVGPSAWAAFARPFAWKTETDNALAFGLDHERAQLKTSQGIFFSWLQPVVTLPREYTENIATHDSEKAREFLAYAIPVITNSQNLYEDIDGAFIIKIFNNSDHECFYVLSEMRKVINSNVRILSVIFSFIVAIVLLGNIFYSERIDFFSLLWNHNNIMTIEFNIFNSHYNHIISKSSINKAIFGILSCCLGMTTMWIFYKTEYSNFQQNNGRELNNFLTHYLDHLSFNFKSVQVESGNVMKEKDVNVISEKSVLWFITLQWIAFRVFFIESFLRTIIFQILRNSGYYISFVPLSFLFTILSIGHYANFSQVNVLEAQSNIYQQNSFYVFFAILLSVYYRYLKNSVSFIMESVREQEWTQFHDLNMHHTLTTLIEAYTNEIALWRHRYNWPD